MQSGDELLKKYNDLYIEILMRYKDYIEEKERLYVADLPKLVIPGDENVVSVAKKIQASFPSYVYEQNFLDAAKLAVRYVELEIAEVKMPIQVWMTPGETIRIGAGDVFDKAVLLCSLLIALGNFSAKVISVATEGEGKFVVYFELNGKVFFTDLQKGFEEAASKDELLSRVGIGKDTEVTAYEFNDKMYNDIA